jgi:hypothetical protein
MGGDGGTCSVNGDAVATRCNHCPNRRVQPGSWRMPNNRYFCVGRLGAIETCNGHDSRCYWNSNWRTNGHSLGLGQWFCHSSRNNHDNDDIHNNNHNIVHHEHNFNNGAGQSANDINKTGPPS